MSCKNCNDSQDGNYEASADGSVVRLKNGGKAYYRWGNTNIEMNGCDKHLREVFDALNMVQAYDRKNKS